MNGEETKERIVAWLREIVLDECIDRSSSCPRCCAVLQIAADIENDAYRKVKPQTKPVGPTEPPEVLEIPDTYLSLCKRKGWRDPRTEVDRCLAWHRTKGTKSKNWLETLKLWLINQAKYDKEKPSPRVIQPAKPPQGQKPKQLSQEERRRILDEIHAEERAKTPSQ